jgi:hypothetical protein
MGDVDVMKTSTGSSITSTDFCTSSPSDPFTGFDDCPFDDSGLVLEDKREAGQRFTSGGSSGGGTESIELQNVALPASSVDASCFFSSAGSESCQDRDAEMFEQVSYCFSSWL